MTSMVMVFFQEIKTHGGLFSEETKHELFQSINSQYKHLNLSSSKTVIQILSEVILHHFQALQSKNQSNKALSILLHFENPTNKNVISFFNGHN